MCGRILLFLISFFSHLKTAGILITMSPDKDELKQELGVLIDRKTQKRQNFMNKLGFQLKMVVQFQEVVWKGATSDTSLIKNASNQADMVIDGDGGKEVLGNTLPS